MLSQKQVRQAKDNLQYPVMMRCAYMCLPDVNIIESGVFR